MGQDDESHVNSFEVTRKTASMVRDILTLGTKLDCKQDFSVIRPTLVPVMYGYLTLISWEYFKEGSLWALTKASFFM